MKSLKIRKFGLIIFLALLMCIPIAKSLGITGPIPSDLRMMRGDSAEINFQIQAVASSSKLSCTLYTEDFEPLIFTFETPVTVDAGTIKTVYGTVTIPDDAPIKTYSGIVFASCSPFAEEPGISGSVITQTMGMKYDLDVVATEAERNIRTFVKRAPPTPPEEEVPGISTSTVITILTIVIAVLVVGFYYWSERRKKKVSS